ncbi:unnamed protein product [Hermetia illucens]|uniref:Pentatricopeptide repeat-containing protein-mitochondrial domain-containing protein n=2 Tax=Hermetia illucens TaxID=343691 RepID=A0A7R8YV04_HERIL|nr:unnamed protein product [Hermetia illucens]
MASQLFRNCLKLNRNLARLCVAGKRWDPRKVTPARIGLYRRYCIAVDAKDDEALKLDNATFDQLRREIQNNGFINHKLFEKLIGTTSPKDISDEEAVLLITSCAHFFPTASYMEKINLFRKTWDQLKKDIKLNRKHYLCALEVFRANKFPFAEYQMMLKDLALEMDQEMFEGLIGLACEHGDMDEATTILAIMKEKNYPITENVFNSLILGYSRSGDVRNCDNVVATMVAADMEPSHKTYTELIKAYVENHESDKAIQLLKEHKGTLKIDGLVGIMKTAALHESADVVKEVITMLPSEMVDVLEVPDQIRVICTELVFGGKVDSAFLVVNHFPTPKFSENQDTDKFGKSLISDLIRTRQTPAKTIEICKKLIESGKNQRALHVASEIALRRDPEMGLEYLKALGEVEELRPHYFWPLILYRAGQQGEVGVINVLKEMAKLNVEIDYETMSSYVFPRTSVTCKNVKNAITTLEDAGLKTSQILTPFIAYLLLQQRFEDIGWILQTYHSKIETDMLIKSLINVASNLRVAKNSGQFSKVIAMLQAKSSNPKADLPGEVLLEIIGNNRRISNPEVVTNLVNEFKMAGVKMSFEAADSLKTFLGSSKKDDNNLKGMVTKGLNLRQSEKLGTHPRDMSLEELEYHLIELENKGMNTRGVLRRTLQLAVREGKYQRAQEIHKKCLDLNVQRSPGMIASVFEMNVKLGNMEGATNTIQELKKAYPGFQLDEHKVIDYATLLVKNGKIKDAKAILKQRASATKIMGGEYVSKNVWELLNACAHYAAQSDPKNDRNLTRDLLEYLNTLGYCAFSNVHLGTIIREYLLKKDIFKAVTEFRRIANQYRKTPLQLELMSELVRLSSAPGNEHYHSLLQEVVREATKIHGALNTNINLILAIAESGTQSQLRKLLIDPQFKFNEDNLMRNCEHLSGAGKINVLLKLAKATRGLGHIIKEQDLYNILLNTFVRENNHASAIELFDRLEADDDFKISQDFVRSLVDLLKRNNLQIPSNVALRAQVM